MVSEIHFWEKLNQEDKQKKISIFFEKSNKIDNLIDYFDEFSHNLSKKNLNYFLKGVSNA